MKDIVDRLRDKAFVGPTMEAAHLKRIEWIAADEIERLREALREVVEAWDWWQEDTYDRCASVPAKAVDAARAALGEGKDD